MCSNGALFNPLCLYQYEKWIFGKRRFKPEILSGLSFYIHLKNAFIYFYKLSSWTCIIRPCNCTSSICDPLPLINYKSIIRSLHFVGFRFSTPPAGDCRSLVDCYESVWIAISLSSWTSKGWATLILCQSIRMPLECAYTTALTILNSCGRQNASSTCIISGATIHTRWQTKNCQETHGAT